jgi:lipopolysaccharide biosynthesis protein
MQQNHTPEDHEKVFCELLRYISDKRYMRIDGRPVVIIYRPAIIPDVQEMVAIWRAAAARAGVPPPYLVATTAFGFSDPGSINFDGLVQFPPHAVSVGEMNDQIQLLNPGFVGTVYDYGETVTAFTQNLEDLREKPRTTAFFPGVMTGWDNEARKPGRGHVFHNATPSGFHQWLKQALAFSSAYNRPSEQIVFINAWNEWAEGTYLEPDRRYGYAYLSAVAAARAERLPAPTALLTLAAALDTPPTSDAVICCHCFYEDLIDEFAGVIAEARRVRRFDVILSVPPHWTPEALAFAIAAISPVRVIVSENRGRDVWPFIQSLRLARGLGYTFGCKVHSKKSLHLPAGERWRHGLIGGLLGEDAVRAAVEIFDRDPKAGLVAPTEAFFDTHDENAARANRPAMAALLKRFDAGAAPAGKFVAGTMFWFRVAALERLALSDLDAEDFGSELGAVDGTVAHAFERLFPTMVAAAGYAIGDYPAPDAKPPY